MPHRTARHGGSARGTWLVSLAMWATGLRFAGDAPPFPDGPASRRLPRRQL